MQTTKVELFLLTCSKIIFITISVFESSKAEVGSSANITFGLFITALAIATRCASPKLRFLTSWLLFPERPSSPIQNLNTQTQFTDSRFFHTGPTGIVYNLEILPDPESPSIAPRNFAIAREPGGAVVLKGPKSFSSSIDVLLNEIKFRIDNQLS